MTDLNADPEHAPDDIDEPALTSLDMTGTDLPVALSATGEDSTPPGALSSSCPA